MARIEPRTLKGFRDYLPEAMIPREHLIETARRVYRSYGFLPIDTPALEYAEILTGKGGEESDKQLYRFLDHGGRDVALRFDLTVPLARFVAQHANDLGMPFKRYHIGSVWRGENTQRGRYREFMQCDFDTIGTESVVSDIETALVINDLMLAIGFKDFKIHINNRKLLTGLIERHELTDKASYVLRAIDKLEKIGQTQAIEEIQATTGISYERARDVVVSVQVASPSPEVTVSLEESRRSMEALGKGTSIGEQGLEELTRILDGLKAARIPEERIQPDLSIARGLDYYTGAVFETVLLHKEVKGIGSVCSGGRYDDLASVYTNQKLPGVGASLGLDRLLTAMEELGMIEKRRSTAPVFLAFFEAARLGDYLKLAADLRAAGIGVELYPEAKKLGNQLKYADRRGFPVALIVGETEWQSNQVQVKALATGETELLTLRRPNQLLGSELLAKLAALTHPARGLSP